MRHPGGTPKMKMGPREMNSKMVVVVVGPSLMLCCKKCVSERNEVSDLDVLLSHVSFLPMPQGET